MYYVKFNERILKRSFCFAVWILVVLCGFCNLLTALWHQQSFPLKLHLEGFSNFNMEPLKNQNFVQLKSSELKNEDLGPESQVYKVDTSGHANANLKSPDISFSESKPVLNYSLQTGEEFSLEFMLDRVNPRKPFNPNISGDPSSTPVYSELKTILGISHPGAESSSDISMIATEEKSSREFDRRNSTLHGDKGNHGSSHSMQSVPHASSDYNSHRKLMYTSSGASDNIMKLKILLSFGGRILPRPSDGKLRYVGGETRMIRISKDITWQELWQKTISIYDETHMIKYQLPGEDLDALVSVSSDEDLLNMMEECNELEDGDGSKKLRMFLFSLRDLDDAHFGLANSDGDSEMKYVVAVNSMDFVSRKGSTLRGLASSSGNNLNELGTSNLERDSNRAATEFVGVSASNLAGFVVPSTITESSKPILGSSSNLYETGLHFYPGQNVHHDEDKQHPAQLEYGLHTSNYTLSEIALTQSSYGPILQQNGLEEKSLSGSDIQGMKVPEKEAKLKLDGSIQLESGSKQMWANEHFVPSQAYIGKPKVSFPVEESTTVVPKLDREISSMTSRSEGRPSEPVQVSKRFDAVKPSELPKYSGNEYSASSNAPDLESVNSESNTTDLSYFESSIQPQRIYYSERIPREPADSHGRISKSDDSHSSQFLVNQSRSDITQQDIVPGSVDKLQNGNVNNPTEQSNSIEKKFPLEPETLANGCRAPKLKQEDSIKVKDSMHENQVLMAEAEADLKIPEDTGKLSDDPMTLLDDRVGNHSIGNDAHEHPQPLTWSGTDVESNVGVPKHEQGDIVIDINDRFPRDLLSDIFSKAILSDGSSDIGPLPKDGAGLSVNLENHEPKHWSFFKRLAGDEFVRRDVSLIDQDHIFSSGLPGVEEEAPLAYDFVPLTRDGITPSGMGVQEHYGEHIQKDIHGGDGAASVALNFNTTQVKASEGMHYDDLMDNMRIGDPEYEDGNGDIGLPPLDLSLVDFDIDSLQIIGNADLEELRELGSGTFGTVYHGKWRGSDVAIKRIKRSCFTGRQSEQERLTIEFWREAEILSKLHHPNVVAFYGVVQDGPGGTLATVTEFMVDGSLRHVLLRKDRHLDRRKRLIIAMDAAFGMEYLHSKNIVHFDLKCDNLLVNLKDPSRPICKVGDFGLSKIKRNTLVSGGVRGTLPWMAPELLNGSSSKVSEKVDVFSFGIVLWEILTGEEPYTNMHYGAIIGGIVNNTLRPTIPSYCDPDWKRLMEECWAPNPAVRPSFTEIASRLRVMSASAQTRKASS
ncbi:hypothetical protein ACJIZ3_012902 [Penstemon smallii]|uniref:Protein kinase domain-containing protein n=1 Tax=Penstemon smallii TaxID=265156 RepID=A0ABD3URW3_9LAMI